MITPDDNQNKTNVLVQLNAKSPQEEMPTGKDNRAARATQVVGCTGIASSWGLETDER